MSNSQQPALAGKVAIVTGGARNIGRATALALAADGARVVVNARQDGAAAEAVADEIKATGGDSLAYIADITDEDAVADLVAAAVARFGRIDILVSNAALRRQQPFLEISLAEWHEILSVPLDGAFLTTRACIPHMIDAGGGTIVMLGGASAHIGTPNRAHVCAAKAGLIGLTHALAVEMAPHNIRVNCVAPGSIDTVRGASAGARPATVTTDTEPLGRTGLPEELAGMIRHLCRPEAAYITGQTIHVNGGIFLA